uniref:Putative a kinase anchor protein n=1 Tax=Amblyomma aureolatum TaxID=187763 RepID=A0A1E1XCQ4_9ACAR
MADDLKTVKEIIVSLLIAEKGSMTIPRLEQEYRLSEGCGLPYAKFGCTDVRQFLNKISDSVSVGRGFNGEELVSAKVSRSVQHINRMVQQQKPSAAKHKMKQTKAYASSQRGRSPRGRPTGRGRNNYHVGTRQPPVTPHITPQQSSAPLRPSAARVLPKDCGSSSSRSSLLPSPALLPSPTSSASNGKGPSGGPSLSRLHNYLAKASSTCDAATGSPVSVDAKYSARAALPESLAQGIKHEASQQVHISVPHAHQIWQPAPTTFQQEQPNTGSVCQPSASQPVSAKKLQFYTPHNSIVDLWKEQNSSMSLHACHETSFSGAFAASHCQAGVRPSLLSHSFMVQPAEKSVMHGSDSCTETMYSMLNPSAATYEPKTCKLGQSSTTEDRQEVKEDITHKELADKQTQAVVVELKNTETSTVDLAVRTPDGFSECVKTLLEKHTHGLEVEVLLRMCRDRMGSNAYFMCDRLPLEMAADVLASVSSVCVVSNSEGKCTVKLLDSSRSENPDTSATLPDDLSDGLMSVLFDYPQGLSVSELLSLYERRFGRHDYISTHGQCTIDFVRNVVIALPHTSLTSHGDGIYTVKLYREYPPEHQMLHVGKPAPFSSADESDTSEDTGAYSVQEVPKSQPFSVVLGEVFNPSEFYILLIENGMLAMLEDLMTELDKFYSTTPADFYAVDRSTVKPGFVCAALYPIDGKPVWHRAVVKSVRAHMVYVSYIDYGTVMPVKVQDIRRLRSDFLELPAQAIKASLAGVKPLDADSWPSKANDRFLQLARMGQCICSVVSKEEDTFVVKLEQCSGSSECSFGDVLISEGLAASEKKNGSESFVQTWALSGGRTADVVTWNAVQYMSGIGISKLFGEQSDVVTEWLAKKKNRFSSCCFRQRMLPRTSL